MGCSITAARGECLLPHSVKMPLFQNKETCVTLGSLSVLLWPQAPISTVAAVFMLLSLQHPR